jgi:NitT/TauT family transport system permease protein
MTTSSSKGRRLRLYAGRTAVVVLVLGLWELASWTIASPFWIGRPSAVGQALVDWVRDGTLVAQVAPTLLETAVGFVLGAAVGVTAGFALGYLRTVDAVLTPFVTAMYTLPKIALAPIVLLWFGIGFNAKAVLSALLVFFLVFFNTHAGVREVDADLVDGVRLMGASQPRLIWLVFVPHAAAWMFAGFRLALPYALVGAVVGEMLTSNEGIGYLLATAANQFDTTHAFAALAVLVVIGLALTGLVSIVESRVQRWQPQRINNISSSW